MKVVNQFNIKRKKVFKCISKHNYHMHKNGKAIKTRMHSDKQNECINFYIEINKKRKYNIKSEWFNSVYQNPKSVKREEPFVDAILIKTNDYNKEKK
uniref:Uncharacterized protein n=1 Tax=Symphyocladiella dendroidea TaxID=2506487 RepID=A0A1Z1M7G4_9FLOR|nr:hypothetical protein [Symphyocladiella dendroidea]ARW61956.1 hypothetical protein [Symphyocladiella dendroidea]